MITENLQAVRKLIKQIEAYNKINFCINVVQVMIDKLEAHIIDSVNTEMVQDTWDYYVELTGGNVTTGIVLSDIKTTFSKFIIAK